jgi:hypothetical protein
MERKPLSTQEEIDDAYPEHAKLRQLEGQEEGANMLWFYLYRNHLKQVEQDLGDVLEHVWEGSDTEVMGEQLSRLYEFKQMLYQCRPGHGDPRRLILEAIGINWDVFWQEKDDMMEQLRLAQEG